MSARCQPGDMAFAVAPAPDYLLGAMVEVLRAGPPPRCGYTAPFAHLAHVPHWVVRSSRPLLGFDEDTRLLGADTEFCVPDSCLRPIRGGDGADETLSWAPVPVVSQRRPVHGGFPDLVPS